MEVKIIFLVLAAAFLHAAWNALVKASSDRLVVIASVSLVQSVAGALALLFSPPPILAVGRRSQFLLYSIIFTRYPCFKSTDLET